MKNYLSNSNSKLSKDGIFSWGVPAYRSKTGKITCPAAGACLKGCYARQGFYIMPSVSDAQEARLALALTKAFVPTIDAEIKRRKITRIRIHDSGDFFSASYLAKWAQIASLNSETTFYAYTKMIPLFQGKSLPENFRVTFSEGGKFDAQIKTTDAHSRVFPSVESLHAAGYSDAHESDLPTLQGQPRIGLVYHGAASKAWTTNAA